ncbi:signal peptidase II [Buchnera aphidicola (Periphyllus koelreuteriae)]|uniref:signal peptidase II n=1 Tax=Buchnera aphidicola TaxID=9 RepID=UPI0031B85649
MKKFLFNKKIYILLLIILIIYIDYFSKILILKNFKINQKKIILSNFNIFYVQNHGLMFEIFSKKNIFQNNYLYKIYIIFTCIIIYKIYYFFKTNKINIYTFIFLFSGAIGNFIDRIKYKFVIDFIDFHYKNVHFPIFNLSDISIILGVIFFFKKNNFL